MSKPWSKRMFPNLIVQLLDIIWNCFYLHPLESCATWTSCGWIVPAHPLESSNLLHMVCESESKMHQGCSVCSVQLPQAQWFMHCESAAHKSALDSVLDREIKRLHPLRRACEDACLGYVVPDKGATSFYCYFCNCHLQDLNDGKFRFVLVLLLLAQFLTVLKGYLFWSTLLLRSMERKFESFWMTLVLAPVIASNWPLAASS